MAQPERGVEIATGRRQTDGHMRLALFTRDLLALTVEGYGERAPTVIQGSCAPTIYGSPRRRARWISHSPIARSLLARWI